MVPEPVMLQEFGEELHPVPRLGEQAGAVGTHTDQA